VITEATIVPYPICPVSVEYLFRSLTDGFSRSRFAKIEDANDSVLTLNHKVRLQRRANNRRGGSILAPAFPVDCGRKVI
jgi:hypothetical protein